MDKFDSLRKSIRQILKEEDQLGGMSPEELKRLRLSLAAQPQIGQDDVEVKDTPPVVDEKVIDDILYRNKYKIGYVEYNGLMHLLCVLKVYGQNNPLPQDLKDFLNLVKDYATGSLKSTSSKTPDSLNKPSLIGQSQEIEPELKRTASHDIRNKNRLVEADTIAVSNLRAQIETIIRSFYPLPGRERKLRTDSVTDAITAANTSISQGLGFFTEVLFYTYVTNPLLWENKEKEFSVLSKVFDLHLKDLKTDEDAYNASIDFAVMYFLLYEAKDKNRNAYFDLLNEYFKNDQWYFRDNDVDELAKQYSNKCHEPLNHCLGILRKLQSKFSNSKWKTGRREGDSSMPQYDLWLVEQKEKDQEVVYAKIDIKTQLPNRVIAPTKSKHSSIGDAEYYGFINFEKTNSPFINTGFGDFKYTVKYLIITKTDVNQLVKTHINIAGKEYEEIFALGDGDDYHPKEYRDEDFHSSNDLDLFTLTNYATNYPYEVEETSPKKDTVKTSFALDELNNEEIDINFIKEHFLLGKINKSPSYAAGKGLGKEIKRQYDIIRQHFKEKLSSKLNEIDTNNFPIVALNSEEEKKLSDEFIKGADYIDKINFKKNKKTVANKLYINHSLFYSIIEKSLQETFKETNLKIPFFIQSDFNRGKYAHRDSPIPDDTLFSILDSFIKGTVREVLNRYHNIIYKLCTPGKKNDPSSRRNVPLDFMMYFIKNNYSDGLLVKLDNEYKKVIKIASKNNYDNITAESYSQTKSLLRNVIKNILEEGDKKKSYRGSHPEECYGWSAKEEDFMFDLPGLTTWEEDRQWVKEYLKSMGMLKNKK